MLDGTISTFENTIKEFEKRVEADMDEFSESDEYHEMYDNLKEMEERIGAELESLPYDKVSEETMEEFDGYNLRFKKCQKRIKKIEDETDINDSNDSSWMYDHDDEN